MRRTSEKLGAGQPAAAVSPAITVAAPGEVPEEVALAAGKIILSDDPRKEQLGQIARDYHDATVRIIRMWLQEDINKARLGTDNGISAEVVSEN
jgi:hypothetical protein